VLNGIAYDQQAHRLFITGKDWPEIVQIKVESAPQQP
jgi:glutamine cyclotransferase